jgi:hypothetical protein
MTVEQIKKFIKESIDNDIRWERVHLIGGEPTLHPSLLEIINLLIDYKNNYSPKTAIWLVTNGYGLHVNKVLEKIPPSILINNSYKKTAVQLFYAFNMAPQDKPNYKLGEYEDGCANYSSCGIGLNPYGYYCCGIAGGIDRILGLDIGRKSIPKYDDDMIDHLRVFCKLCGIFSSFRLVRKTKISKTWGKMYEKYRNQKPKLTAY